MEVLLHRLECTEEQFTGGTVDLANGLQQRLACGHQVVPLGHQELEPLLLLGVLLHGQRIHRANRIQRLDNPGVLGFERR